MVICFSYRCDGLPDIVPLMNSLSVLNYFSSEDFLLKGSAERQLIEVQRSQCKGGIKIV